MLHGWASSCNSSASKVVSIREASWKHYAVVSHSSEVLMPDELSFNLQDVSEHVDYVEVAVGSWKPYDSYSNHPLLLHPNLVGVSYRIVDAEGIAHFEGESFSLPRAVSFNAHAQVLARSNSLNVYVASLEDKVSMDGFSFRVSGCRLIFYDNLDGVGFQASSPVIIL